MSSAPEGPPAISRSLAAAASPTLSALVLLFVMAATAGGTALAAPLITDGLAALAAVALALAAAGIACLALLPRLTGAGTAAAGTATGEGESA